jgi:hypothetical protein
MDVICSSPEVLCWAFSFSTGCRQWLCGKRYTQLLNMEVSCFGISTMMIEVDIVLQLRTVFNFLELILVRYEPLDFFYQKYHMEFLINIIKIKRQCHELKYCTSINIYINKINSTNQNKQKERFFILIAKGKKKKVFFIWAGLKILRSPI